MNFNAIKIVILITKLKLRSKNSKSIIDDDTLYFSEKFSSQMNQGLRHIDIDVLGGLNWMNILSNS